MNKLRFLFQLSCLLFLGFLPGTSGAQDRQLITVQGQVYNASKQPLSGAVVRVAGEKQQEVLTNEQGLFSLEAPNDGVLQIAAKGYAQAEIKVSPNLPDITLQSEKKSELVQVAFRKVQQRDLLGGVSSVQVNELLQRNYFTYSLDGMEALASGYNGNSNWGMGGYLLMVDGVPREVGSVLPTEIDQITFLKGASAVALYGSRAAKGVVLITTKRGEEGQNKIDVRVNSGVNVPKLFPNYLGSAEYMTLYNEARANDGLTPFFQQENIYQHASGNNPFRYPNVDYYSPEYLNRMYMRHDATAEISGGNEKARYYTNIGYNTTGSLLNFGEAKRNDRADRFNLRGNIDVKLNDYLKLNVDATAIFYTGRGVNANYWSSAANLRPHRFAPLIPISLVEEDDEATQLLIRNAANLIDGRYLLGGTQLEPTNPFASIYAGGNNQFTSRQFQFNTGVGGDLRNVLEGLTFQTNLAVDYATSYNLSFNNQYTTYEPVWTNYAGGDLIASLNRYGQDARSGVQNVSGSFYRQTIAVSGQLNYQKEINRVHRISSMLLVNGFQQSESQVYHRISNANLGLQAGYQYKDKYYADFTGAVVHSARLPENNRRAFSPTLSLGWRMSEESWLKGVNWLNDLKLTASAGILHTDLDIAEYYMYQGFYTGQGAWYGWKDGVGIQATESRRGDNPNLQFPKREEISIGVEATLFDRSLRFNGNVFANRITGNVIQASILFPSYFATGWPVSSFIPFVNYNSDQRVGFDFGLTYSKKVGTVKLEAGVNGTFYRTKAIQRAEIFEDAYQNRQGRPLDAMWGLRSAGFFRDQADIDQWASQTFGQVRPGDIKYVDQNGDGLIDNRDEVYLGRGGWFGAPFTSGFHVSAQWKGFTFFALGIWRMGGNAMRNNSYFWIDGEDKYSEVVRNRWTPATHETATFPRLTTLISDNNYRSSDFWMYKTNRLDLGKVQISYDLSDMLKQKKMVKQLGVYLSGFNLLTVSKERRLMEMNVGSAPQTRLYNLGITAGF